MAEKKTGRPKKEFDKREFSDLVGYGCTQEEICWFFRDRDTGVPVHPDTLSRWCLRTYGMSFKEYKDKNSLMPLKIKLRQNQLKLSEKSAAMAIFLGKQYLGQTDHIEVATAITDNTREEVGALVNELNKTRRSKDTDTDSV